MKRIYDNLLLLLLCLSGLCSCDDVMDTHKAFIQGGEIIYAPMPVSYTHLTISTLL